MRQPPYSFAEPRTGKPNRWPVLRIATWVVLFAAMGAWAYLILAT